MIVTSGTRPGGVPLTSAPHLFAALSVRLRRTMRRPTPAHGPTGPVDVPRAGTVAAPCAGRSAHAVRRGSEFHVSDDNGARRRGVRIVGTSLTPEFWERFAVLLVAAMGVTFALTAAMDALALRVARRCARRAVEQAPPRTATPVPRTAVRL